MEAYIQGVADTFREHLPTKTLASAFPEKVHISKGNKPDEGEAKANQAKGYMRAGGMILWVVRHCFPEGKYGASQLCGVMACPSDAAFAAAMHMIAYFEQHKTKCILFSANGNTRPVCTSDASNKPDPDDGLVHARVKWVQTKFNIIIRNYDKGAEWSNFSETTINAVWLRRLEKTYQITRDNFTNPY